MMGPVLAMGLLLAGCVVPEQPLGTQTAAPERSDQVLADQAIRNFVDAVNAVGPVAEAYCRQRTRGASCDFQIVVDDRKDQPANAFQTLDRRGNPVLGFTLALIADARNVDELAFVMGHEAAHHILGHIPQTEQSAITGALLGGILAAAGGGSPEAIEAAQKAGATVGARRFSKGFELEADALGTEITERAGFSAIRGAQFFTRIPDPGDQFLGSHPPNRSRIETVRKVVANLPR
jgi:predicted Zn-dependent protease